jgi:hypothetical protein
VWVNPDCLHLFDALRNLPQYSIEIQLISSVPVMVRKMNVFCHQKMPKSASRSTLPSSRDTTICLANAKLEKDEFDPALATIKQGMTIEAYKPEPQKQMKQIKTKRLTTYIYTGKKSDNVPRNVTHVKIHPSLKAIKDLAFVWCSTIS